MMKLEPYSIEHVLTVDLAKGVEVDQSNRGALSGPRLRGTYHALEAMHDRIGKALEFYDKATRTREVGHE